MRTLAFIVLGCDLLGLVVTLTTGSFAAYLLLCALATIACFGLDKLSAFRQGERMPERFLLLQALIGGAIPMLLAMPLFHHKSRKPSFYAPVALFALFHIFIFWRLAL